MIELHDTTKPELPGPFGGPYTLDQIEEVHAKLIEFMKRHCEGDAGPIQRYLGYQVALDRYRVITDDLAKKQGKAFRDLEARWLQEKQTRMDMRDALSSLRDSLEAKSLFDRLVESVCRRFLSFIGCPASKRE